MNNDKSISELRDENNELKIEIDNLKRDKKVLINAIEQMGIQARTQLYNLEKTLDMFREFKKKITCVPPPGSKSLEPNINDCNIISGRRSK